MSCLLLLLGAVVVLVLATGCLLVLVLQGQEDGHPRRHKEDP